MISKDLFVFLSVITHTRSGYYVYSIQNVCNTVTGKFLSTITKLHFEPYTLLQFTIPNILPLCNEVHLSSTLLSDAEICFKSSYCISEVQTILNEL